MAPVAFSGSGMFPVSAPSVASGSHSNGVTQSLCIELIMHSVQRDGWQLPEIKKEVIVYKITQVRSLNPNLAPILLNMQG